MNQMPFKEVLKKLENQKKKEWNLNLLFSNNKQNIQNIF